MRRSLLVAAVAAAAVSIPGSARAAACSPLNCAASQFGVDGTSLVGYRPSAWGRVTVVDLRTGARRFLLPGGVVGGHRLVHGAGRTITWYDLRTGAKLDETRLPWRVRLAGVSQDGSRAFGFRGSTTFVIAGPRAWRQLTLPTGNWDFDALRGRNLFLIRYLRSGGYQVALMDLGTDSPRIRVLKGSIWGMPFARLASPDGRLLFTLYIASNGATMVHELDLARGTAECIDLPGSGNYNDAVSWSMSLAPDGRTLWAASPGYGRVVGVDVASRKVVADHRLRLPWWNLGNATRAAVSPDGRSLALTDGETVARVALADGAVVRRFKSRAKAVGYAPDGTLRAVR